MLRTTLSSMLLLAAVACSKQEEKNPVAAAPTPPPAEKSTADKEKATINAAADMDIPSNFNFTAVQFAYDSCDLSDTARAQLEQAAKYLQDNRQLHVTIAGHADDRGTAEYNLALGEKRAAACRT